MNGAAFAAGQRGITAPYIGLESYDGSAKVFGKDYYLKKEDGITGSDWCHVRFILDAESTPSSLTSFRLFLRGGTGGTIWDDITIKPVETAVEFTDETGTKMVEGVTEANNATYTVRAQYSAEEGIADGVIHISAYNCADNGSIQLIKENSTPVSEDGRTVLCRLDGINPTGNGQTVINAVLKNAKGMVVKTAQIKKSMVPEPDWADSFENVAGTQPAKATEWVNASVVSGTARTGTKSIKLSGTNARALFEIPNLFIGTQYTLSFWYKGTVESGDGLVVRRLQWAENAAEPVYKHMYDSEGKTSVNEWTRYTYTFTQYEGTISKIGPMLKNGTGTVYIDDITLIPSADAPSARVVTDQVFYYSDLDGNGKATVFLNPRLAGKGLKANIRLMDKDAVRKEEIGAAFINNRITFEYSLALLSELKKEYRIEAEIVDSTGIISYGTYVQKIYKYNRPSTVSKDGTFTDINGKRINPTFMYHIPYEDFATAASAGINVVQYNPDTSDVDTVLAQLDEMYEMGVYAGYVTYWGMYPAGNAVNYERVKNFIEQIKHHPAIFCYMVMDEPFLNNPNAYEDMRKSYIMLREVDPDRPLYICEGFPAYMEDVAKYCDIIAPDPYPTGVGGDMATFVSDMVGHAHQYVNYNKPVLTIQQAFTQAGKKPTALQLHSMIYQSLLAGGNAVGFYTWLPDDAVADQKINEGIYWPMIQTFYTEEKSIVYDYYAYGKGEEFVSSKETDGDIWYEGWWDESGNTIYMAVQNRDANNAVSANIPLISNDRNITITDYTIEEIGYGATGTTVTKKTNSFDVNLAACGAVLLKLDVTNKKTHSENIIVNGSFEKNAADNKTEITGWEQVNQNAPLYTWNTVGSAYNPPADGNYVVYADKTNTEPSGIKQTIALDTDADWYINRSKYAFDLTASIYGGVGNTYITATVKNAAGETKTQTYAHVYGQTLSNMTEEYILTGNAMNDVRVGFASLINSVPAPTTLTIEIGTSGEGSWDNVQLIPRLNLVCNGSFEADTGVVRTGESMPAAEAITGWERTTDAKVYYVVKQANPWLIPKDGENMLFAESGVDTVSQKVTLDINADYYINQDKYSFDLSFWYYHNAKITVTAYSADEKVSASMSCVPATAYGNGLAYAIRYASINIDDILRQVGKAKYIVIELSANGARQTGWDNVVLTPSYKTAEDNNIIINGGLEILSESGVPQGWAFRYPDYELENIISETATSVGGSNYVKLTKTSVGGKNYGGMLLQDLRLEQGKMYDLEVTYKSIEDGAALIALSNRADWSGVYGTSVSATGTDWETAGWRTFKTRIAITEDYASGVQLALRCHPDATTDVYYDNIILTEVDITDSDNLLINGGFEHDSVGATEFVGWEVNDLGENYNSTVTERDGNKVLSHNYDIVSQTVNTVEDSGYRLEFDYSSPNGGRMGITIKYSYEDSSQDAQVTYTGVRVDAEGNITEDKTVKEGATKSEYDTYAPMLENGTGFAYIVGSAFTHVSIDLTRLMPAATSTLKSVTVQLNNVGTIAVLDNFVLSSTGNEQTGRYTYRFLDSDGLVVKETTAEAGTKIVAPDAPFGDEGYVFSHWEGYEEGMTVTKNVTFTAVYKYAYTITTDGNGKTVTVLSDNYFVLSPQQKQNYSFEGYYTKAGGQGTKITDEKGNSLEGYGFTENITVYPYFIRTFTVTGEDIETGMMVILVLYKGDCLAEMLYKTYEGEDIVFKSETEYDTAKVMVWDELGSLSPVTDAKIIN